MAETDGGSRAGAGRLIAARWGCYGNHRDEMWSHLPANGIRHLEIVAPAAEDLPALQEKLAASGLSVSSVQAKCDVQREDVAETMAPGLDTCAELGAGVCFVSVHGGDLDRDVLWERLRSVGDQAARRGVVVAMETHPDLASSGELALETMRSIDHPQVRINFDAANIYYYNRGRTTLDELRTILDYVAAVHLKDSTGQFRALEFPTLGEGIVDFPGLFELLDSRNFPGPYTMELEGGEEGRSRAQQLAHVADSIAYLSRIRAFR